MANRQEYMRVYYRDKYTTDPDYQEKTKAISAKNYLLIKEDPVKYEALKQKKRESYHRLKAKHQIS